MTTKQRYLVLVGINYGPQQKRAEPGDVVNDIPARSLEWMIPQGIVQPAADEPAPVGEE